MRRSPPGPGPTSRPLRWCSAAWATSIDWLASLRAKAGYLSGATLFYATGGIAWAGWSYDVVDGIGGFRTVDAAGFSRVSTGAVVGGGVEHAFNEHASFRMEALHYMFGDKVDTSWLVVDSSLGDFAELRNVTVFRAGLNFKLPIR